MIPVFIPSKGRATRKHVDSGPFPTMPEGQHVVYVVPEDELSAYQRLGVPAIPRPSNVQGIGMVRQWIGQVAKAWECPKFMMIDDDLKLAVRIAPDGTKLRHATEADMAELLYHVEAGLDYYENLGVSLRQGNNHCDPGPAPLLKENTRISGAVAFRTDTFLSVEHCRVPVMEDFDVLLQLLRRGVKNCCFYHWAFNQSMTNAAGGCSTYRTRELQHEAAHALAALHPGFVRPRLKQNKTDADGLGTRTEVTVYWKKAFQSSQE